MRQIQTTLNRIATLVAQRLLAWVTKHVDPEQQLWLDALRAELDVIDGGIARLLWALGGLRLIWFDRRRHMVNATFRYGPVLLYGLGAALFVGLMWSLIQSYGSLAILLLEMTGFGVLVTAPGLILSGRAILRRVAARHVARDLDRISLRRIRLLLPLVPGLLSLITLLVLWQSAPATLNQLIDEQGLATGGVVVRSADHRAAETVLDQIGSRSHAEVYLTTQVKPLAVDGAPLVLALERNQSPFPSSCLPSNAVQKLVDRLTGIQGYDLAHGQAPPGGLLSAHDANTLNVVVPLGENDNSACQGYDLNYYIDTGSTITVQSLTTGRTLNLHVVGTYDWGDGFANPLFGQVLADNSVLQALTDGHPSYAYGLHLSGNQLQIVPERLHTRVPTAQFYNFLTGPTDRNTEPHYALFTDPDPVGGFFASPINPPPHLGTVAFLWSGLLVMIIVLSWGAYILRDCAKITSLSLTKQEHAR
jgi:hypothetical protein